MANGILKKAALATLAAASIFTLASCNKDKEDNTVFSTTYTSHYDTLNHLKSSVNNNGDIYAKLVDGLVEINEYDQFVPALAESWTDEINAKGESVYTFKIKEDVKWVTNDQKEYANVVAQDWVDAAKFILNPKNNSDYVDIYATFIKGAGEYNCSLEESKTASCKTVYPNPNINFEDIGVKAIDDTTLEFTLTSPKDYFLSILTYSAFYPLNGNFYLSKGTSFGQNKGSILINGPFTINEDIKDSLISFNKNEKYWDKDSVYVDEVKLKFYKGDKGDHETRQLYENGDIDSFKVKEKDTAGWEKYVTGPNGEGSIDDLYSDDAYINESVDKYTRFSTFNLDRDDFKDDDTYESRTEKTDEQFEDTKKALLNENFRKALFYSMDKDSWGAYYTPSNHSQWYRNTLTPEDYVEDENGKDYIDYLMQLVADLDGISLDEAKAKYKDGEEGIQQIDKAKEFAEKAKNDLTAQGVTFPVVIDVLGGTTAAINAVYTDIANNMNRDIPDFVDIFVIEPQNDDDFSEIVNHNDLDFHYLNGWGPDYLDPLTFLDIFSESGQMLDRIGFEDVEDARAIREDLFKDYYKYLNEGKQIELTGGDKSAKFEAYAKAEFELTYGSALIKPYIVIRGESVYVSRTRPYTRSTKSVGLGSVKYKNLIVFKDTISIEDRTRMKEEYDAAKEKAIKENGSIDQNWTPIKYEMLA